MGRRIHGCLLDLPWRVWAAVFWATACRDTSFGSTASFQTCMPWFLHVRCHPMHSSLLPSSRPPFVFTLLVALLLHTLACRSPLVRLGLRFCEHYRLAGNCLCLLTRGALSPERVHVAV